MYPRKKSDIIVNVTRSKSYWRIQRANWKTQITMGRLCYGKNRCEGSKTEYN